MILQLYMILTSNELPLNAVLSLDNGLPKDIHEVFCIGTPLIFLLRHNCLSSNREKIRL